jgi:hypothetical protein
VHVQDLDHQGTLVFFESAKALLAGADSHHLVSAERSYHFRPDFGHLAVYLYHFLTTSRSPGHFLGIFASDRNFNEMDIPRSVCPEIISNVDGLAKSRHTGENRCPVIQQLSENTGFRLSPE